MLRTVFLTAANRPEYFRETISSWRDVRNVADWELVIRIEPTDRLSDMLEVLEGFETSVDHRVIINDRIIGAPTHPWVSFEEAFQHSEYTVSVEDDLPVSDDFLEYHTWASSHYASDEEIATISSFSVEGQDPAAVFRQSGFASWGFGTWKDRWEGYIRDTWDGNYSTFETAPGDRSGWDWNLNLRVLPRLGKKTIFPEVSRIQNIGVHGVHGTAENFVRSQNFELHRPPVQLGHER